MASLLLNRLRKTNSNLADSIGKISDIKKEIEDSIIESWLAVLCKQYQHCSYWSTFVISSYLNWRDAKEELKDGLKAALEKLVRNPLLYQGKTLLFVPWHKDKNHWVLIVVRLNIAHDMIYMDSLAPSKPSRTFKKDVAAVCQDISYILGTYSGISLGATCYTLPALPRQTDAKSCGIYLMVYAAYLAEGKIILSSTKANTLGYRLQIFAQLLHHQSEPLEAWEAIKRPI